jgi:hypothetical protein
MNLQREVMNHHRDVIGASGFFKQWRRARAVGTLEVFEYNNRNLGALWRTERGIVPALGDHGTNEQYGTCEHH